jgi:hypothetical protein
LALNVQFRGVPPRFAQFTDSIFPYRRIEDNKQKPTRKKDHSHMKPQATVLINREATKHDIDKWMEDLFARIQLCLMHPHSVIQQNGTTNDEETMFEELVSPPL